MSHDPYSDRVRELFLAADHAGDLSSATTAFAGDQGLEIRLFALHNDRVITEIKFRARGCPHAIAAAEHVCRQFDGADIAQLSTFDGESIMRDLSVPVEKTGRILVLEDAVRSLHLAIMGRLDGDARIGK